MSIRLYVIKDVAILEITTALGVLIPILFCVNIIPWFGCCASLVNIILIPIYMYQVLNAINQLVIESSP